MSRPHSPSVSDKDMRDVQERVAQQEALVRRLIVQGAPNQAAEDRLHQLQQTLLRLKDQRSHARASDVQRKMRRHWTK